MNALSFFGATCPVLAALSVARTARQSPGGTAQPGLSAPASRHVRLCTPSQALRDTGCPPRAREVGLWRCEEPLIHPKDHEATPNPACGTLDTLHLAAGAPRPHPALHQGPCILRPLGCPEGPLRLLSWPRCLGGEGSRSTPETLASGKSCTVSLASSQTSRKHLGALRAPQLPHPCLSPSVAGQLPHD